MTSDTQCYEIQIQITVRDPTGGSGLQSPQGNVAKTRTLTFWRPWFRYPLRLGPGFDFGNTVIEPGAVRGHRVVCLRGEEKVWIGCF